MHFSCKRSNFSFECLPIWNVYITTLLLIKLRFDFAGLSQMIVVMGKENSSLRIIGFSKSRKYFFFVECCKMLESECRKWVYLSSLYYLSLK